MKKSLRYCLIFVLLGLILPFALIAREIEPIVSTDWLEKNLNNPKMVIVDIRKVEDYKAGHITNALNVVYGSWAVMKNGLRNEIPPIDDLSDVISAAGINPDSLVVVVGKTDNIPNRTDITRVAWTLKFAGMGNVAILDGGFDKWAADKKALSTDMVKANTSNYQAKINAGLFADKAYVMNAVGKALIVDVREPEFYQGTKKLDFVAKLGRIKGAVNLPGSQAYTTDGTFKSKADLAALVTAVVGADTAKEVILSCDTGKVCTVWSFIMTDLLGYTNIKTYDGSMEEWMKDPMAPTEP
jgi:thiosulfate/3-mercaptopyruvate sulfurtransferase